MRELTIIDLFNILMDNIKIIITSVIIGIILSILYTTLLLTPMYESSTKIILVKPTTDTTTVGQTVTTGLTANDVALNQKLVSTYSEIIKSKKVLNEVIDNLNLDITAESISRNITISPVKDSEVMNITVLNEDPNEASDIANEIITSFAKQVKEIYKIENVNQVDKAEPSLLPNNVSLLKNIMLFSLIAFILSYGLLFILEYFKTTIKSPEDIEDTLGLTILAILPDLDRKV
ncbi:MAG: Wzz/FepE/Etk N-terminal domain-containing protein [Clostridia bacterium]|nr:Wzz/FepE/Etk N-terminal domain-containing protein [Clostridia bacterium]MDD4386508.1 Wzz/FepE/Etk N-terminal domain-containing protein [Clostridia bacterium]